jgi:hypothetical protein
MSLAKSFFHKSEFREGKLSVTFGNDGQAYGTVVFDYVRAFLFFKEGDFFRELEKHEREEIELQGAYPYVKVFKILRCPILKPVVADRLDEEQPRYFLFWTPDECFEVVAFAGPEIIMHNPIEKRAK